MEKTVEVLFLFDHLHTLLYKANISFYNCLNLYGMVGGKKTKGEMQ